MHCSIRRGGASLVLHYVFVACCLLLGSDCCGYCHYQRVQLSDSSNSNSSTYRYMRALTAFVIKHTVNVLFKADKLTEMSGITCTSTLTFDFFVKDGNNLGKWFSMILAS